MRKTVVIGAAGAGKTSFMIESVSRLLKEEVADGGILILASSARSINDIRARLNNIRPDTEIAVSRVAAHTVRSLCEAALRDSEPGIQILSDFGTWFILRERIRALRQSNTVKGRLLQRTCWNV